MEQRQSLWRLMSPGDRAPRHSLSVAKSFGVHSSSTHRQVGDECQGWVDQQLGLGLAAAVVEVWEFMVLLFAVFGLFELLGLLLLVWPGPGGWGVGQGVAGPPAGPSWSLGGRMLMVRSQFSARRGQCSSGALGGCMPKPWPPVAK